jgi:glycine dehydrogenase subunit 1
VPDLDAALARAREAGINPGYPLRRDYPEFSDGLLVAVTERRTREHIDRLAELLGGASSARASQPASSGVGV